MKDPAFLFYSSDFLTGVADLTMEERGQYITLMCLQHQKGHLSEKTIRLALGLPKPNQMDNHMDNQMAEQIKDVLSKFIIDEDGLYYSKRLDEEIKRREKIAEKRRKSGQLGGNPSLTSSKSDKQTDNQMDNHMATQIETETEDITEDVSLTKDVVLFKEVIDYLNNKIQTSFKHSSSKTQDLIKARLREGFTLQDFITVIDKKVAEWIDTDMQKFLRPETLFSNKFEGYLNQKITKPKAISQKTNFEQRQYSDDFFKELDGGAV
jgi:uncharacterized phage protein (TIGR02220 family)